MAGSRALLYVLIFLIQNEMQREYHLYYKMCYSKFRNHAILQGDEGYELTETIVAYLYNIKQINGYEDILNDRHLKYIWLNSRNAYG